MIPEIVWFVCATQLSATDLAYQIGNGQEISMPKDCHYLSHLDFPQKELKSVTNMDQIILDDGTLVDIGFVRTASGVVGYSAGRSKFMG